MHKSGPIIIIEDDRDDQFIMGQMLEDIAFGNKVMFFSDPVEGLTYLKQQDVHPFLILCDVNMPKMDGMELRAEIFKDDALNRKCVPFLFFTTFASKKVVCDAYKMSAQGFFQKPADHFTLREILSSIISYWKFCSSPNMYG